MNAYTNLAPYYGELMSHVDYAGWADFAQRHFARLNRPVKLVLDLACGVGALSGILAERGYEVIGADASPDMLSVASANNILHEKPPLFLCQPMQSLDLYGTVDAAVCSLDSLNYLPSLDTLKQALGRVCLFLEPGGLFLFDVRTPAHFAAMDGQAAVVETDRLYCVWQTDWNARALTARHSVSLFVQEGALWRRINEEHRQRAYANDCWEALLIEAGFTDVRLYGDRVWRRPRPDESRIFISARKL